MDETKLEERLRKVSEDAQTEYSQDPLGAAIAHLEDVECDVSGYESEDFVSGFGYAIHCAKWTYLAHSREFQCGCRYPAPEKHVGDVWKCGFCGETLATEEGLKEVIRG